MGKPVIEDALGEAAINDNLAIVQHLCNLPINSPSQQARARALQMAVKANSWDIVDYFCSFPSNLLQRALDLSLLSVVKSKQLFAIQHLYNLTASKPSKRASEQALQQAIKMGELAIISCICSRFSPSQPFIEQALLLAVKFKQQAIVRFLCERPENMLHIKVIELALRKATSSNQADINIAKYLRGLLQDLQPRDHEKTKNFPAEEVSEQLNTHGLFSSKHKQERSKRVFSPSAVVEVESANLSDSGTLGL